MALSKGLRKISECIKEAVPRDPGWGVTMAQNALTKAKGTYEVLSNEGIRRHGCRQKVFSDRHYRNVMVSFIYGLEKASMESKAAPKWGYRRFASAAEVGLDEDRMTCD